MLIVAVLLAEAQSTPFVGALPFDQKSSWPVVMVQLEGVHGVAELERKQYRMLTVLDGMLCRARVRREESGLTQFDVVVVRVTPLLSVTTTCALALRGNASPKSANNARMK